MIKVERETALETPYENTLKAIGERGFIGNATRMAYNLVTMPIQASVEEWVADRETFSSWRKLSQ